MFSCTLNILSKYWVMIFHVLRKWLTKQTIIQRSLSYITQVHQLIIFFYLSFNLSFRYWRQRSRSYRGHDFKHHIILWWYTQVPNIVWLCQRTTTGPWATSLTWENVQIKKTIIIIIMLIQRRKKPIIYFVRIECLFIWTSLNPLHPRMLCGRFGWNWPNGSGKNI